MPPRSLRDLERTYSPRQFAAKLRRLADAIERGRPFTIQVAGESMRIPGDAEFNVEHERARDGTEELEFQLRWRRDDATPARRAPKRSR
jgi:amphi-Trp domain-containing protein